MEIFCYWSNLKRDVVDFVARCFDCERKKNSNISGMLQPIMISKWKWEVISMHFIRGFLKTSRQHDSIMVVVKRLR